MGDLEFLAQVLEKNRPHLRAVAYRMLGSANEADDAVQEAWFRLQRTDTSAVENLGGWLTTVVARVSLDMLRSRRSRREDLGEQVPEAVDRTGPEDEALLADSVGLALLVVMDTLTPVERLVFVLHDMFALPFDEIAQIVERSPAATRQLASRARRRVQGSEAAPEAERATGLGRRREIVDAFLAASRNGDFEALLSVLDPQVVYRADRVAVQAGSAPESRGVHAVAEVFLGRAKAARTALVDGDVAAVWQAGGQTRAVFEFTIVDGLISAIELSSEPERLAELDIMLLEN